MQPRRGLDVAHAIPDNIAEHRAILGAIRHKDAAAARRAMRTHLANAERERLILLRQRTP